MHNHLPCKKQKKIVVVSTVVRSPVFYECSGVLKYTFKAYMK